MITNREEAVAYQFLRNQFGGEIYHEPDGNVPPDFLLNSQCAVEVRRLNQHFLNGDRPVALESLAIPLWSAFQEVLRSFDGEFSGASHWVFIDYRRPLAGTIKETKQALRAALHQYLENFAGENKTIEVNDRIDLSIMPSNPVAGRVFRPAGSSDDDFGGWLVQVYVENIRHCIAEKSVKISPHRHRYPCWWLLLVDQIGWGLDLAEAQQVVDGVSDLGVFERVLVVDRGGKRTLVELVRQSME